MKKWIITPIILIVLGVIGWALFRSSAPKPPQVVQVKRGDIKETVVATGELVPRHAIQLKSVIPGKVGRVLVSEGDRVKAGERLVVVKPNITPIALSQALASLSQAKATYKNDFVLYRQQEVTFKMGATPRNGLVNAKSAFEVAKAKLLLARQQYDLLLKGRTHINGKAVENNIVSPINGYVLNISVDEGDTITPSTDYQSGTPLMTLANMKQLVFKGEVSQVDVGKLGKGMPATLTVAALPKLKIDGRLTRINLQSTAATASQNVGTSQLFSTPSTLQSGFGIEVGGFKLPKGHVLRAGYQATATILVAEKKQVLVLPQTALHFAKNSVYVLLSGKKQPKKQTVTLGLTNADNVQILTGLRVGQAVIESHQSNESNG